MATEFAPAKVNLTLHVTGQRADGYHLLDSLVVFADVGDRVSLRHDAALSLTITGPQAAALPVSDDNLVLRAARLMGGAAAITLDKVLPVASGIGGGSADAAACLRALAQLGRALPTEAEVLRLGADVPVCLRGVPLRMQGVGEVLTVLPPLPEAWLVLVNPGVGVATPAVFRGLARKDNPPMPELPPMAAAPALADFLHQMRNDLEPAAQAVAPVIGAVKAALAAQPGCLLARMSGSGATCFGLFGSAGAAEAAARAVQSAEPGWWVAPARMLS
ncbi:4-(cytidine 5'-diphospho)-2-C-methyl-D-erythritol kinase [Pseudorhodobacter sp. MZDSW-24AT]|uniref:4-(cytidine 5'-diphospho)-2-C-methyl-D-erythritol kinase n=1 Tax=Pseudorhodobacter sp. MZDSW-24AT TaxID=2052957 RepID=UPI000C1F5F68|nr:4-(cytidine 5'-diphospho)-2-C-methyl-D-erythritol kinase [Pseudorhodobacter sp. MZDSW-24AT]PJF10126.1 4-(cytidine 5'-diphospho)-2-C-methyl-D-erythritol kinase [Pseudorhodobacter sp. MZDSW-24AT]